MLERKVMKKMDKELLILHGARYAVIEMINKGSSSFVKHLEDGTWQSIEWADICNYLTETIKNYKTESGEKIIILKMELGEQAEILYHLLTEQMTKARIKTESEG